MMPIDQSITGSRGNCFSACLASLLEIPDVDTVPLFLTEKTDTRPMQWMDRLDAWLARRGLYALHFDGGTEDALPNVFYILGGMSPRGRPHAVVAHGREIVHDPHPDKSGLLYADSFVLLVPRFDGVGRRSGEERTGYYVPGLFPETREWLKGKA